MAKKIDELLEGKTREEVIERFKRKTVYEVGRARRLGQVEALFGEGYTPLQIAEKLGIAESSVRRLVYEVEKLKK